MRSPTALVGFSVQPVPSPSPQTAPDGVPTETSPMFSHVILGVSNLDVSKKFYDAVLGALGVPAGVANKNRYF